MSTPFVSCPVDVFRTKVSSTAYKVFLVLKSFDNKDHKIFPSKKTLAEKCGLGLTSIYKAIKELVKAGFVTVLSRFDYNGRQTSNFYEITTPSGEQTARFSVDTEVLKQSLSAVELKIYSCLSCHADENEQCYPSRKQIAQECHLSITTVYRTIHRLERRGFLRIDMQIRPNGGTRQNLYTLLSVSGQEQENINTAPKKSMAELRLRAECAKKAVAEIMKKFPMVYAPDFPQRE